jgi:hypothetical protein
MGKRKDLHLVELVELRQRVAELEAAEGERRKSRTREERYRSLFNASRDAIFVINLLGEYQDVNPAGIDMLGYSLEELRQMKVDDILVAEEGFSPAARRQAWKYGTTIRTSLRQKDGHEVPVELTTSPVGEGAEQELVLGIARDITEQLGVEQAKRRNQERLEKAQRVAKMGFLDWDLEKDEIFWSEEVYWIFGVDPQQRILTIESTLGMAHPEDVDFVQEALDLAIRGEKAYDIVHRIVRPDGETVWVHAQGELIRDAQGRPKTLLGTVIDITEMVQVEEELRESQLRYRTLTEHAPVGIWHAEPDGSGGYINPKMAEISGLSIDSARGTGWSSALHPDDRGRVFEAWTAFVEGKSPYYETYRFQKPDGEVRWVLGEATPAYDVHGGLVGYIGTLTDITKRVQVEEERERIWEKVQEQARRVQQIVDTVPEGVLLITAEGEIILANPVAEKQLALLAGAQVGDKIRHLGDYALSEILSLPVGNARHEVKVDDRSYEVIARPLEKSPRPGEWVMVIGDVTQERRIQARVHQQERLASLGQMAAGIAHDFNNILSVIVLYASFGLQLPDLPAKLREYLETISQQSEWGANLIEQILDFSRRTALELRPTDLKGFMEEQVELLRRTLPENIELNLDCGQGEYLFNADPTSMQQVVMNLAVNAQDAMPDGGLLGIALDRMWVEEQREAPLPEMETGGWLRLIFSDTGAGIPADDLSHIFEPFFTTKAPGEGTGLGLAQVYGIIKQHKGEIDVISQLDIGTKFIIYLPVLAEEERSS